MAHILVVDDRRTMREMLEESLLDAGHTVSTAANGVEALVRHRERPAALVICDIFMPEKDGLSTIRELRRDHPNLAIIAMSGGHQDLTPPESYIQLAQRFGANEVLIKPFPLERLHALVEKLLPI